ncbi:Dimethylaniline monooxygenase [N-oxide-forming] 5 [Tolypocladium paradoxum]|uniref:Dimethylaniline monooxygenase [N-oxide-forming] 5 n=1 Tax=Tolypocladium paradoxum TaxID=94208 RepID=A0A2S4L752_9HYPO|nr:Dimethylaniline monooxygenase [N-oxide-forming] 5 [Tolypocladium paradoxum]
MGKIKVAVVGLGPAGLTAIKSLREEGFETVGFERRDRVGGVWSYSHDPDYTTVIQGTISNVSKFVSGFSDFPVPNGASCQQANRESTILTSTPDYPPYMTGNQVSEYFRAYARHFQLERHIRFKTTVRRVLRDKADRGWNVHVTAPDGDAVLHFDKVVFGTGSDSVPMWPPMPGREMFEGAVIHGQSYRGPEQFAGKRVLVVGIGNTACEVSLSLTKCASRVYQSYRRGRFMVSRYIDNGIPTDCTVPWPILRLQDLLDYKLPWLAGPLADWLMKRKMIRDAARVLPHGLGPSERERSRRKGAEKQIKRDWRLLPCASMAHVHPVVQEDFIPALYSGLVTPLPGFTAFADAHAVLFNDGSSVEVDAVIFCTGYALDFSIMPELEMDGTCGLPLVTAGEAHARGHAGGVVHLPRLQHMVFPPRWASSVAFLSWMSPIETYWCVCELASMAVAQVWAAEAARGLALSQPPDGYRRPALLPSEVEMNAEVDKYHVWWRTERKKEPSMHPGLVRSHTFYRFLHDMAGTGMYDNIDHPLTFRGLLLQWKDSQLHKWLAKGPANSYAWRLFETNPRRIPGCGRQAWPGARRTVEDARDMKDEELRRGAMVDG